MPTTALKTQFRNRTVADVARDVVALASQGLARRGNLNGEGMDETIFLSSLEETLATDMTPADHVLREYDEDWHGNIDKIFETHAY